MPLLFLVLLLVSGSLSASTIELDASNLSRSLANDLSYFEDDSNIMDILEVQSQPVTRWQKNDFHSFNKGYGHSTWWLTIRLSNPGNKDLQRLLEIAYPVLDYVDVYLVGKEQNKHFAMGDKLPFHQRPINHRHFVVPIHLAANESVTVYIKLRSTSALQAPIQLWEPSYFHDADRTKSIIHGMYFGIMLVMALYNLFVFLAVGEKSYIFYVLFVVSFPLFLASLNGFTFQYLWPTATLWNDKAILVFLTLSMIFGTLFTLKFLDLKNTNRFFYQAGRVFIANGLVVLGLVFIIPYDPAIFIVIGSACVCCIFGVWGGFYRWFSGGLSAKYYALAWSGVLVGGLIMALSKNNIIHKTLLSDYATQIGSALEVMLLSFALAERINQERRMRYQAQEDALRTERALRFTQEQALETQKRTTESLEIRVQERTRDLELLNQKLERLSDTDQLTGLNNRRFLDRTVDELLKNREKAPFSIACLLIDVDHFKSFNDLYGHQTGDRCLCLVAKKIKHSLPASYSHVARYGGEEFCVVMADTNESQAINFADTIRSNIESMEFTVKDQFIQVTVSIGVAGFSANEFPRLEELTANADKALYLAKAQGRNRVCSYDIETTQQLNVSRKHLAATSNGKLADRRGKS